MKLATGMQIRSGYSDQIKTLHENISDIQMKQGKKHFHWFVMLVALMCGFHINVKSFTNTTP